MSARLRVSLAQCWFFFGVLNINPWRNPNVRDKIQIHTEIMSRLLTVSPMQKLFTTSQKAAERVERNFYSHNSVSIIAISIESCRQLENWAVNGRKGWKLVPGWPDWPPNCYQAQAVRASVLTIQGFHQTWVIINYRQMPLHIVLLPRGSSQRWQMSLRVECDNSSSSSSSSVTLSFHLVFHMLRQFKTNLFSLFVSTFYRK